MDGYREQENIDNEDEKQCVDIDECDEQQGLCGVGTYCSNTIGSYECKGNGKVFSQQNYTSVLNKITLQTF